MEKKSLRHQKRMKLKVMAESNKVEKKIVLHRMTVLKAMVVNRIL